MVRILCDGDDLRVVPQLSGIIAPAEVPADRVRIPEVVVRHGFVNDGDVWFSLLSIGVFRSEVVTKQQRQADGLKVSRCHTIGSNLPVLTGATGVAFDRTAPGCSGAGGQSGPGHTDCAD